MTVAPKPSSSVPPRRGSVRSDAAIAHRWKDYERRLVKRIRIAGCLAVLQGIAGASVALFARRWGLNPWIVGSVAALAFVAAVGIFLKVRLAGIVVVAIQVLNIALVIRSNAWTGLVLPVVFLLAYVDGLRALFAWSRMRATAPAPKLDIEALQ